MPTDELLILLHDSNEEERKVLRVVMKFAMDRVTDGQIADLDKLLKEIDPMKCSTLVLVGMLRTTYSKAKFLKNWATLFDRVTTTLQQREPERWVGLLRGLSEPYELSPWSNQMDDLIGVHKSLRTKNDN